MQVVATVDGMSRQSTKEKPQAGRAIAARRAFLDKSLMDIERLTDGRLYTKLLSRVENGDKPLNSLDLGELQLLLEQLEWSLDDFRRETGIKLSRLHDSEATDYAAPIGFHLAQVIGVAEMGQPSMYPVPDALWRRGTRVLRVKGFSMDNGSPNSLSDGDWVCVDTSQTQLVEGKVFCFEIIGNGFTVKRARKIGGEWWLTSDNPLFENYRPEEARLTGQVYAAFGPREL